MTNRIDPREITAQQYGAWRQHPMTRFMLQYMDDFADTLVAKANADWLAGTLELKDSDEMRGRINCLKEVTTLPWSAIAAFYGIEKPEEESNGKPSTE